MPIYVQYASLKGDVTESKHAQWIEVNSFQWGVGRGISSPTGGSSDREASAPSVSEIVVTKPTDASSVSLLTEALTGEGQPVTIDFCKTDKGNLTTFLTYTLTNTMVSGLSLSSGGDRPQESVSFNFTKIETKMTTLKPDGSPGDPATITYDIGLAKTV